MNPRATLKRGIAAAFRRRYGYAALRTLRRAVRHALLQHNLRSAAQRPYTSQLPDIYDLAFRATRRLIARFPDLNYDDPRAQP